MWPINGKYTCAECLREYPVAWNFPEVYPHTMSQSGHDSSNTVFTGDRSALTHY